MKINVNHPLVSVIVVNWNGGEYLSKCLNSIFGQTYENLEIILVDNDSSDGSIEYVEKNFQKVHVIRNKENVGFAEGNNIGINHSKGDILALVNPDAVIEKDWLLILVNAIQNSEKIGAMSGKIFYLNDEHGKDRIFCTWPKLDQYTAMPFNFHNNEPMSKVDYLSGAAMILKKEIISKVGMMDKDYFLYFEETDWCARMIRAGYELVYIPNAIAWHKVSASISDTDKKIYYMERSRMRFALKNFDLPYIPIFLGIFLLESLFIFLRDVRKRNFSRSKIRRRVIFWNMMHIWDTTNSRKQDIFHIKKYATVASYNKSLPLRKFKAR